MLTVADGWHVTVAEASRGVAAESAVGHLSAAAEKHVS
jgi:hypothetical protein